LFEAMTDQLTKVKHVHLLMLLSHIPIVDYHIDTLEEGAMRAAQMFNQWFGHLAQKKLTHEMILERMEELGLTDIRIGQEPYWIAVVKCAGECQSHWLN
jgi:hypothetical protein